MLFPASLPLLIFSLFFLCRSFLYCFLYFFSSCFSTPSLSIYTPTAATLSLSLSLSLSVSLFVLLPLSPSLSIPTPPFLFHPPSLSPFISLSPSFYIPPLALSLCSSIGCIVFRPALGMGMLSYALWLGGYRS